MSDPHLPRPFPFSMEQREAFLRQDQRILSQVVVIMSVIFLIGVGLYAFIAWVTAHAV
ncbi:MAG: hypothetical protein SNJ82_05060 [Gemmataceae bacterium]